MRQLPYLARCETFADFAGRSFVERDERERDRMLGATVESAVAAILRAPAFDASHLAELNSRDRYAVAFAVLARVAKLNETQIVPLTDPVGERLQSLRAAIAFGAIPAAYGPESFVLADLLRIKTPNALAALAACGVISWHSASRRVRAVFCLRELIGASRS